MVKRSYHRSYRAIYHWLLMPSSEINSARWRKLYNPDLIFASINIENMCEKFILDPIPHTQHRPICTTVKPVIVPQSTPFRIHFNLRKSDWLGYSTEVDQNIDEVDATPKCYEKFLRMIILTSRKLTIFLVSQTNSRHYMNHTKNSINVTN